LARRFSEIF